ncbi:hypothetical protein ACEWY4_018085 [Coilia grayii]|uniref:Ig-like domain-containing protein n=1 Tax=Coilia grayii TaxID=363190 RepID=A0ABD1JIP1_9TELE
MGSLDSRSYGKTGVLHCCHRSSSLEVCFYHKLKVCTERALVVKGTMCTMVVVETLIVAALCTAVSGLPGQWAVRYDPKAVCALRGSTVELHSTYSYPSTHTLHSIVWHVEWPSHEEPTNISHLPDYSSRVEYLRNTRSQKSSTLRIRDVRESDSRQYLFRLLTYSGKLPYSKYTGVPGIQLHVTGLEVQVSTDVVTEGQDVTLTCSTTCGLGSSVTYAWYKNGIPTTHYSHYKLYLNSVSIKDSGSYSCAVKKGQHLSSPSIRINVTYSPKNTSAFLYPPGEILEGGSVTLVCKADANPPVHTYTWFKQDGAKTTQMEMGQNYSIANVSSEQSGQYHCRARNMLNEATSASLKLNVKYPPRSFKTVVSPSGDILEGTSVFLTCSSDANPPVHTYTWYKARGAHSSNVGAGQNYSLPNVTRRHSGEYYCNAENLKGSRNSTPVHVDVLYLPKNVSVSVSSLEGSVTLTCSNDAHPPVQSYTWYRKTETETSRRGRGEQLTLEYAESGFYYCEAKNKVGATISELNFIPDQSIATRYATVFTVAIGALIVCALLVLFRKKIFRLTGTEDTHDSEQDGLSPVYVNISRMGMTSDPKEERAHPLHVDDIHYTSVHFKHCDKQEVPFNILEMPEHPLPDEEVLYSTVKFHHL